MCWPQNDFTVGSRDVKLGEAGGARFWIVVSRYDTRKHTDLSIEVVPRCGGKVGIGNGREKCFPTRSEFCSI